MCMTGAREISIVPLHLNNELVKGEAPPAFELLEEKILNFTSMAIWAIHLPFKYSLGCLGRQL